MPSERAEKIARVYSQRHGEARRDVFGEKPYANFGYWNREGMTAEEACDALTDETARIIGIGPGDRVLEVGCGYGAGAVLYTSRYHPASVMGIDITDVRVQGAREYVAKHGLSGTIEFRLGSATDVDSPAESFSKVIAIECAFHFETRRDFFREAARVLVPGGRMGLTDIVSRPGVTREDFLAHIHFPIGSEGGLDVPENVYDAATYAAQLRDAGFDEVRVDPITDRSLAAFARHLERVARASEGELGATRRRVADAFRDVVDSKVADYVLVSARRAVP